MKEASCCRNNRRVVSSDTVQAAPEMGGKNHFLQDELRIFVVVLKTMGVLPMTSGTDGTFSLKICSFLMGYSLVVYLLIAVPAVVTVRSLIMELMSNIRNFDHMIVNLLQLAYIHVYFLIPIFNWFETRHLADYFNSWTVFQEMYLKTTNSEMEPQLRWRTVAAFISCLFFTVFSGQVRPLTLKPWVAAPIIYLQLLTNMTAGWWYLNCKALCNAGAGLRSSLLQAVQAHGGGSPPAVSEHRILWIHLSKLTRDFGYAQQGTYMYFCLYMFVTLTIGAYGSLCDILHFGVTDDQPWIFVVFLHSAAVLFIICNLPHILTNKLGYYLQEEILMADSSAISEQTKAEVELLFTAMSMTPPVINLGGYLEVNRGMFLSMLVTMVTYLVVLLQFKLSWIPPSSNNSTDS